MNKVNMFGGKRTPFLVAEIGSNHEGNFEYALELTRLAVSTGVDFIKSQLYSADSLVSALESPERNNHFKNFELSRQQHIKLAQMVKEHGIGYMASVWDEQMLSWINPYISIYKVGSGDLTAYPLLRAIARKTKPIVLSAGLATEKEVLDTVDFLQSVDAIYKKPAFLAILQCTSMYPINDLDVNLNVIPRLKNLTGLTIGYSDHTAGSKALIYSAAIGAEILEFHFTDNRQAKEFRDHKVSLTPQEVITLRKELKSLGKMKGDCIKQPARIEIDNRHHISFRRAVYPVRDIPAGRILEEHDLICLRPNHGIDARDFERVIGKKVKMNIKKHQKLTWDMVE